jgi:predicted transcriptional regulator
MSLNVTSSGMIPQIRKLEERNLVVVYTNILPSSLYPV